MLNPAPHSRHLRLPDFLKTLAAALIVLHHLAFYGPMADFVRPALPALIDFLANEARYAVQVFLVTGGFLAARALAPQRQVTAMHPLQNALRRYRKLAPPFILATMLAVVASDLAGQLMHHHSLSAPPGMGQMLAHALLLHGVLGYDSLWAGAWYVAIDLQLYVLLALLLAGVRLLAPGAPRTQRWMLPLSVALAGAASLFYFNLDHGWDEFAPYFFGSYSLGVLAWWAGESRSPLRLALLAGAILLLGGLALQFHFRERIALALGIALLLAGARIFSGMFARASGAPAQGAQSGALLAFCGRISYAVFLAHFSACMLVNALFAHYAPHDAVFQGLGMLLAFCASVAAGVGFHFWVELPVARLMAHGLPRHAPRKGQPA